MSQELREMFEKIKREDEAKTTRFFMENARNAMRAVRIAIQENDDEEALRLIAEALGEE